MYDPTFGSTSISRQISKHDFRKLPNLTNENFRDRQVTRAVAIAKAGLGSTSLLINDLAGRKIYNVSDYPTELVLRKACQNIRKITGARQGSRIEIVRRLRALCAEGCPFTLAKLDIKSFYPSVDADALTSDVTRRFMTAPSTRRVLTSFLELCNRSAVPGLPPGLAVSADLSELYMQDFDLKMRREIGAHFYARYVDDMVVVLPEIKNTRAFRKKISRLLPVGLTLNQKKSQFIRFCDQKDNNLPVEHEFDYLGYKFRVSVPSRRRPYTRRVVLDIAPSKVKKIKTRLSRAVLQYLREGDFDDLRDRVRILTCGYQFVDQIKGSKRGAGIQHTYSLIDDTSPSLVELDKFMKGLLVSRSGKISGRLALSISNSQRKELLRHSFKSGFANKVHFKFSADRLEYLMRCWKYA